MPMLSPLGSAPLSRRVGVEPRFLLDEYRHDGGTVYALNDAGVNRFTARLEPGYVSGVGAKNGLATSQAEIEATARLFAASPRMYDTLLRARADLMALAGDVLGVAEALERIDRTIAQVNGVCYHCLAGAGERCRTVFDSGECVADVEYSQETSAA